MSFLLYYIELKAFDMYYHQMSYHDLKAFETHNKGLYDVV